MEYQAISKNSLYFEVLKDGKEIGRMIYKNWFQFNAEIEILHSKYQVEPKGFWGTTIEIKDHENVLLKFKMNWNGEIVIQTYFDNVEKDFIFKHQGVFKDSYLLTDQKGTELIMMKPDFKWKIMNYEYQLSTSAIFETFSHKEILLLCSLHCANYYMSMMASAIG